MSSVSFAPSVPFKYSETEKKPEELDEEDLYAKYKALLRQEEFLDLQVDLSLCISSNIPFITTCYHFRRNISRMRCAT